MLERELETATRCDRIRRLAEAGRFEEADGDAEIVALINWLPAVGSGAVCASVKLRTDHKFDRGTDRSAAPLKTA